MLERLKSLFKAQRSRDQYVQSSLRVIEGSGHLGAKPRPFDNRAAMREFRSWAYAATMINANAVASLPLRLFIRKPAAGEVGVFRTRSINRQRRAYLMGDKGHKPHRSVINKAVEIGDDFEEVTDRHPVTDLLSSVNPWFNGFGLIQLLTIYLETVGNAYWHPVVNNLGVPAELWPMPSQWTFVIPDEEAFIEGYAYGRQTNRQVKFEPDEVIHFRYSNPKDDGLFYGMGKMEAAWQAVGLNAANLEMDTALADNHARPDYLAIAKSGAGEDQLNRFERAVESKLRGTRKSGRFLTITGDITLEPLAFTPKDMAGRSEVVEEVAAIFGVPVSMLKANDPNLANAKQGYAMWRESTILPISCVIEGELNERLLPMFGLEDDAVLAFDNPVPADEAFDLNRHTSLVNAGIETRNEARSDMGLEESGDENADALLVNGQPLGAAPAPPFGGFGGGPVAMVNTTAAPKQDEKVTRQLGESKAVDQADLLYKDDGCGVVNKVDADDDIRARQPNTPENQFRQAVRVIFGDLFTDISNADNTGQMLGVLDGMRDRVAAVITPSLSDMLLASGNAAVAQLGLDRTLEIATPEVARFVRGQTTILSGQLTATTRASVERVIQEGILRGQSTSEIAAGIRETGAFSRDRAQAIARTEAANAHVSGKLESWRTSGVVQGKRWLLAPNACEFCRGLNSQFQGRAIPLSQPFFKVGQTVRGADGGTLRVSFRDIMGPPLHPNDRCDIEPVTGEEE